MTDIAVSFTASRDPDDGGREVIVNVLMTAVPFADRYITGGARGGDAFIGRWLAENRPQAKHVVIVPANKSQVDPWWLTHRGGALVEAIPMPAGTTYAARNAELVRRATVLFAFPAYPEDHPESRRSGTWQTARMGRRAGKLSQWHCVKPPYAGRIEVYPADILARRAAHQIQGRPGRGPA